MSKRLLEDVFSVPPNTLMSNPVLPFEAEEKLEACLKRLLNHEPLQYVCGFEWFQGLRIAVGPEVLIPRPETAELVDWVVQDEDTSGKHVMADICTGSGCIALALRKRFPDATIIATDVSKQALALAMENESENFQDTRIKFAEHDILRQAWEFEWPEIVVCNPPYIGLTEAASMERNVLDFEPKLALFVEDEDTLLFYKKVILAFMPMEHTRIYFELNPLTADELVRYCEGLALKMELKKDMQGKNRFARVSKA
jgi:release factor glutamine methyltransferase